MINKTTLLLLIGILFACVHVTAVDDYIMLKRQLIEGTKEEITELTKQVSALNDKNPSLDSQIRLGLVLSSPDQDEKKLLKARRIFDNVLTFSSALSPSVRDFIELNKREINQRLSTNEKIKKNTQTIQDLELQRTQLQHRIKLLQQDLSETNKKIKALKTIEESIDRSKKLEMP